jgi:RNA polymerase sigma factor (sigma-70 family)
MAAARRGPEELATARLNNRDRLAEVYAAYQPWAVRWISGRVRERDRHVAEDLAQNTFLRAWSGLDKAPTGEREREMYPWLATIARGEVAAYYRRGAGQQRAAEQPTAVDSSVWNSTRHAVGPALDAPADATAARLCEALDGLPARTRQAVELHIAHGMSQSAVAQEMRCEKTTVRRRAHEGLAALREQLASFGTPPASHAGTADPLARARQAVAEVRQRVAAQDHADEQDRTHQLARWHADDQAALAQHRGDDRGLAALAAEGGAP